MDEEAAGYAVLNSGGPLLEVETIFEQSGRRKVLCRWRDDEGKIARSVFDSACLSRLVPFEEMA